MEINISNFNSQKVLVFCEGSGLIRDIVQDEKTRNEILLLWLNTCANDQDKNVLGLLKAYLIGTDKLTSFQKGRILFEIL